MRYAVIDIGSNTVRMNIYDVDADNPPVFRKILTEYDNTGLLNYVNHRVLSDDGIFRLIEVLSNFKNIAENIMCDKSFYFATASLRNIDNKKDVLSPVRDLGIEIEMISGESEALLSFEGLKLSFGDKIKSGFMVDMGGGSMELLGFVDGLAVRALSVPFGCLSLYNKYVSAILPLKDELHSIKSYVDRRIAEIRWLKNYGDTAYLVGGTARAIGRLHSLLFHDNANETVCSMTYDELKEVFEFISQSGEDNIKALVRIVPDRLHTFIPGIYLFIRVLKFAETKSIVISPTGIREGYLIRQIMKQ